MEYNILHMISLGIDTGVETSFEVTHYSHGHSWCYFRATACLLADRWGERRSYCLTASRFTGVRTVFGHPGGFFLNANPVARTESIHLKIGLRAVNECRRPAKWRLQSLHSWKRLYDETTLFIRPLHLAMSLVQIHDVLHSSYPYLLIWVVIATELLNNENFAANSMVYRLCILEHSTVMIIL